MRPGAEADDSYGVIEYGSCGFTHSDGVLAYPKDMYAALAGRYCCLIAAIALPIAGSQTQQLPSATCSCSCEPDHIRNAVLHRSTPCIS
jgi:hypothetical protein